LETDASIQGISYILGQRDDEGRKYVVSYGGRGLRQCEKRWPVTQLECLALLTGIKEYHVYLAGRTFSVYTDHLSLKYLQSLKVSANNRLARWALAASTKKSYDLKRLVAKVKNDSVIYHSIADVVTEEMQQVIYDSNFYDLIDPGIDSYKWWLKWMTLGLAAASFILALYLLYKVRMMTGALALLNSRAYATGDVPGVLKYDMSNKGLIKEEIRTDNATFVYEPVKFHLDMATIATTALIVILLVVIWIWYQRSTENQVHLVLELGNGRRYVRLRVLILKGAIYAYDFKARSYIQSLVLIRWPPKLIVNWPSFRMHSILDEVVEVFPKELWINFWNIRTVSEIVQSKSYYCLIMTEYKRQYRLLEFDNKFQEQAKENLAVFTAENHQNERQVVRTVRDRMELQHPVNVLRLYPSLPELREELIDETKF